MRRGAARDSAHLDRDPTAATGLATASVVAELGQSARSLEVGITAAYVGTRHDDTWTRRVNAGFQDPFGLDVTSNVYKRPKWNTVELMQMYKTEGVDPSGRKATRQVREMKYKGHERQWKSSEKNAESRRPPSTIISDSRPALFSLTASRINGVAMRKRRAEPEETDDLDIEIDAADPKHPFPIQDDLDNIKDRIDPLLLCSADHISQVVADVDSAAVLDDRIEEIVLSQLDAPLEIPSALMIPGIAFVNFLSRINVISNKRLASSKSKGIPDTFRGNGRDEPTLFQHQCRKTLGCNYSSDNTYSLLIHEARCSAEKIEIIDTVDKPHACPDCGVSFEKASGLKFRYDNVHDYKPRACGVKGCDLAILYDSRSAFRKHQTAVHPSWTPKRCPIDGCTSEVNFKTAQALKTHIQVTHKIEDKELLKRYTYVKTLSYLPQSYSYPGCVHPTVFKDKKALIAHLEKVHKVAKDDATTYIILE